MAALKKPEPYVVLRFDHELAREVKRMGKQVGDHIGYPQMGVFEIVALPTSGNVFIRRVKGK